MGIINQGILGGLRKKVGNVVGASWKGIPVLKIYQPIVSNPKTAAQTTVRSGFKMLAALASILLASFIKPLWDRGAVRMSGYNAFMQANKETLAAGLNPYEVVLVATKGKMDATAVSAATCTSTGINVTWDGSAGSRYALPSDKCFILVLNETAKNVVFAGAAASQASREDGEQAIAASALANVPSTGDTLHVYLSFQREDGTITSNSAHKEITAA